MIDNNQGFIIEFWSQIFNWLGKISVFNLIRKMKGSISYQFVEGWVLGNLLGAIVCSALVYFSNLNVVWLFYLVVGYGMLRVFEIIIYQLNVLLFDPYRASKRGVVYRIKSPLRMVVLLLHNYAEVMFWYAAITMALIRLSGMPLVAGMGEYIRSSILCVATFDSSGIQELSGNYYPRLSNIVFVQILTGLVMTILSLARFIGLLPAIDSIDA